VYHPLWGLSFLPRHFVNSKSSVHVFGIPWRGEDLEYGLFTCKKSVDQQFGWIAGISAKICFHPPAPLSTLPAQNHPGQNIRVTAVGMGGGGGGFYNLTGRMSPGKVPHDYLPPKTNPQNHLRHYSTLGEAGHLQSSEPGLKKMRV
jgi:hypothetical protein